MRPTKQPNRNVETSAILIIKDPRTGATRKCGALLYDTLLKSDFILISTKIDYNLFKDERYDNDFVKIQIVDNPKEWREG